MTNTSASAPQRSASAVSLRKTNKPLMEKKRRARINDSLSQLKSLVIQSSKKDSSQYNKLEKADILELTVKHLRNLQGIEQQQQQLAQATNVDSTGKYCAGFRECANEVVRFLKQSQGFSDDTKVRVMGHLASCLQLQFNNQPYMAKTSPAQPPLSAANTVAPVLATTTVLGSTQQPNVPAPATAQLSNGQIIHIVNAPFQPAKATVGPYSSPVQIPTSTPSVDPSTPQKQYHHHQQPSPVPLLSVVSSNVPSVVPQSSPSTNPTVYQEKSYTRFSQPLHIQIPAATNVSPPFALKPDNPQPEDMRRHPDFRPVGTTILPKSSLTSSISPAETVHSNLSSSPSPLPSDLPPQTKSKHVHFYPGDIHLHTDYPPRHRTYSTASSSSESEMSPLNLSQSPVSSSTSSCEPLRDSSRYSHRSDLDYLPINYKLDKVSPSSYSQRYSSRELKENVYLAHSANFTSVIVNARRGPLEPKYIGMELEEDRYCPRQHGTPSPASSMGEERLWRPW